MTAVIAIGVGLWTLLTVLQFCLPVWPRRTIGLRIALVSDDGRELAVVETDHPTQAHAVLVFSWRAVGDDGEIAELAAQGRLRVSARAWRGAVGKGPT